MAAARPARPVRSDSPSREPSCRSTRRIAASFVIWDCSRATHEPSNARSPVVRKRASASSSASVKQQAGSTYRSSPRTLPEPLTGADHSVVSGGDGGGRLKPTQRVTHDMSETQPTVEQLLAAGVHFGHQTRRWNPKMRRFIFAERNGIHIIDLQKTLRQIEIAQKLARDVIMRGDNVLFVCTKPQLAQIVRTE